MMLNSKASGAGRRTPLYRLRPDHSIKQRCPASRTGQVADSYRQRREIHGHCSQAPCL